MLKQQAPSSGENVILLIHGIRTQAEWQQRVASVLERIPGTRVIPTRYEYFDIFRFLAPIGRIRQRRVQRIKEHIRTVLRDRPQAQLSIIAHSFGCYVIGAILEQEFDLKINRIVLCGSILPDNYPWHRLGESRVNQVVNECGWRDILPVLAKSSTWGCGASGAFGFGSPLVIDRFHSLSHSEFLREDFVETFWLPFFADGEIVPGRSDRPTTPWGLSVLTVVQIKYFMLAAVVALAIAFLTPAPSLFKRGPDSNENATRASARYENQGGNRAGIYGPTKEIFHSANERQPRKSMSAEVLQRLGRERFLVGDAIGSISYLRDAIEKWEESEDPIGASQAKQMLARIYFKIGELGKALALYDAVIEDWPRWQEGDSKSAVSLSRALQGRASVYSALGRGNQATDDLEEALSMQTEFGKEDLAATTMVSLGKILYDSRDLQRASGYLDIAHERFAQLKDTQGLARCLLIKGLVLSELEDVDDAKDALYEALEHSTIAGDRLSEARVRLQLGRLENVKGLTQAGLKFLGDAVALFKRLESPMDEAAALKALGDGEARRGNLDQAWLHIASSIAILEKIRERAGGKRLRLSFLSSNQDYYDLGVEVLMQRHLKEPSKGFDAQALELSEASRARFLLDVLDRNEIAPSAFVDGTGVVKLNSLRLRISALEARKQELSHEKNAEVELSEIIRLINSAKDMYYRASGSEAVPHAGRIGSDPISLKEIQEDLLDESTLLLEFHLTEKRGFVWAVTKTSFRSHVLKGRALLDVLSEDAYRSLASRRASGSSRSRREAIIDRLSQELLGPVADDIYKARRLLVVADDKLHLVPFAVLRLGNQDTLLSLCEIVNAPSASAVLSLRRRERSRDAPSREIAIIADPVYSRDDPRLGGAGGEDVTRQSLGELRRLPYAREEAAAILSLATSSGNLLAEGFEANAAIARNGQLSDFRLLHFATHSFLDTGALDSSGIFFSMLGENGEAKDGLLRSFEIHNMNLPASLVVLSSCSTALGHRFDGEGYVGATYAFMAAGATRIIASLWDVGDEPTAELMTVFYHELLRGQNPPGQALRAAQMHLVKQDGEWDSPYFWSAFVLQGDWAWEAGSQGSKAN